MLNYWDGQSGASNSTVRVIWGLLLVASYLPIRITDFSPPATRFLLPLQVNKQYSATDLEAFMKIAANWQNSNHNLLEGVDIKTGKLNKTK